MNFSLTLTNDITFYVSNELTFLLYGDCYTVKFDSLLYFNAFHISFVYTVVMTESLCAAKKI